MSQLSKAKKDLATAQASLELPFPPSQDESIAEEVRAAVASSIRRSRRSVEEISGGMTARLGVSVTHQMLYAYAAESHLAHRFPFEFAAAFIRESGSTSLLKVLLDALKLPMPEPDSADLIDFARAQLAAESHRAEAEGLRARILRGGRL